MTKKDMKAKESTELAEGGIDYGADAGDGMQGMDINDLAVPRLSLLQALSPQLQKQKAEYIEGAEQGQILNTVSNVAADGEAGLVIIPVAYVRKYIEWGLREKGGGFIADHGNAPEILMTCTRDDKGRNITPDGTQIVDTMEYYVMVREENGWNRAILSFTSSQLKKGRRWNTIMSQLKVATPNGYIVPAMYASEYKLTTVPESNDMGSWFGWKVERGELSSAESYGIAKEFAAAVGAGEVKDAPHAAPTEDDDSPM